MAEGVTTAVVDADVLYQRYPRNLVIWLAVEGVFSVASSETILGEVNRHLRQRNSEVHGDERADKVERSIDLIREAIGAGAGHLASTDEVENLIESVQAPDPDDRHVVATALAVKANCVVTHNLTDFDAEWCAERGIGLLGLDDFLADLVHGKQIGRNGAGQRYPCILAVWPGSAARERVRHRAEFTRVAPGSGSQLAVVPPDCCATW